MKKILIAFILALAFLPAGAGEKITVEFAQRDTCTLSMDIYKAESAIEKAPTILYVFGGGFKEGDRVRGTGKWFSTLNSYGFNVVSIDYRLGLKGVTMGGLSFVDKLENAINIAVEDLFSATEFLIENGAQYGIDSSNIVLAGSSAGAITVLQAEYEICNGGKLAAALPDDFNYTGVMSFSGAILDRENWGLKFSKKPCPILLLHGTDDKLVPYKRIAALKSTFNGTDAIAKVLKQNAFPFTVLRYADRGHEVSTYGAYCLSEELYFIEKYVVGSSETITDSMVTDPDAPSSAWGRVKPGALYK